MSLKVDQGQFVVLLGLNGAGKSTLFSLITRLYDNVSGEILIRGYDVRRKPTAALQRLGVVFQSRTLDSDLSLIQNLKYHAALHGMNTRRGDRARDGSPRRRRPCRARQGEDTLLSGGQARRVEIARSLMHRPDLLLLDEATVGLDVGSRESVLKIVRDLVVDAAASACCGPRISMDEVKPADHIVVLHKGRVLFDGSVPGFLAKTNAATVSDAFREITGTSAEEAA